MKVLRNLFGGTHKIASTEIAVKDGTGKAVTLDSLPHGFQYSTEEQWTGHYWLDGSKIYTKSFIYDGLGQTNGGVQIKTGLSSANIDEIWLDNSASFARINQDAIGIPINYVSVSTYYRLAVSLIGVTTSSIEIDIKWNANTPLHRTRITLNYTKK